MDYGAGISLGHQAEEANKTSREVNFLPLLAYDDLDVLMKVRSQFLYPLSQKSVLK